MWIVIVIIIVGGIIGGIATISSENKKTRERGDAMKQALLNVPDFSPSMKILGIKNLFTFATDNEHHKILYMAGTTSQIYNYEDIISVEFIENNHIISKKSTGRTIGGAIVGTVVAGGVGAIVGGLSGSSKQQNLHSSVLVKILLRNNTVPSIELTCFDAKSMTPDGKPVKDDDLYYRQGLNQARRITDTLTVIIDAVDRATEAQQQNMSNGGSVAEEIAKLAVLKEKGILSEEEFMKQKSKLLEGVAPVGPQVPLKLELPSSNPFDDELREIIANEGMLKAIKKYKEVKGVDLVTAKEYVESL